MFGLSSIKFCLKSLFKLSELVLHLTWLVTKILVCQFIIWKLRSSDWSAQCENDDDWSAHDLSSILSSWHLNHCLTVWRFLFSGKSSQNTRKWVTSFIIFQLWGEAIRKRQSRNKPLQGFIRWSLKNGVSKTLVAKLVISSLYVHSYL